MSNSLYSKKHWQAAFNSIFNPDPTKDTDDGNELSKYFKPSYSQITGGKKSNFDEFANHVDVVLSHLLKAEFTIHEFVTDGVAVTWRHIATMSMKDGGALELEVFLIGKVDGEGRFERIVESTRKVRGKERDADLGRRV